MYGSEQREAAAQQLNLQATVHKTAPQLDSHRDTELPRKETSAETDSEGDKCAVRKATCSAIPEVLKQKQPVQRAALGEKPGSSQQPQMDSSMGKQHEAHKGLGSSKGSAGEVSGTAAQVKNHGVMDWEAEQRGAGNARDQSNGKRPGNGLFGCSALLPMWLAMCDTM